MLLFYKFFTFFFYPILILIIFLRKFFNKEDKDRYKEKLFPSNFNVKKISGNKLIWFHAASIGEAQSVIPLIKKMIRNDDKTEILITTISLTSSNLLKKEFKNNKKIKHRFFPLDINFLVKKFLLRWRPNMAIFIDSEIWPNFLSEIKKKQIPLVLLNGRITKKTYSKWLLINSSAKEIFALFDLCLVANRESENYLKNLGAKNIKYLGNLKFASENMLENFDHNNKIFKNKNFWCAVSTHKGEDIFIVNTHINLKKINKDSTCIIIPRHTVRSLEISRICQSKNLKYQILSDGDVIDNNKDVVIVNSYGLVPKYLKLCKSVFIGKSLIKKLELVGGQNPIEAAKFGCKIYHGPYVYNFKDIYEQLSKYKITEQINDEVLLSNKLSFDLNNEDLMINQKAISDINNLGNRILNETFKELKEVNAN